MAQGFAPLSGNLAGIESLRLLPGSLGHFGDQGLVVHDKRAPDGNFVKFVPISGRDHDLDRNFVKKAVNWALRSIGKRSIALNQVAVGTAGDNQKRGTRAARWIAADAIRELIGDRDQARLKKR